MGKTKIILNFFNFQLTLTDNDAIKTNFGHKIHISRHTKQNVGAAPYHKIYVDKATGPEPKHNVIITS